MAKGQSHICTLQEVDLCIYGTMGEWAYLINQKQRFAGPQLQISVLTVL